MPAMRVPMRRDLGAVFIYLVFVFLFSWTAWAPLYFSNATVIAGSGFPTHIPGLLGPALAAFAAAAVVRDRRMQLADLLRRSVRLPVGFTGWLLALSPAILITIGAAIGRIVGQPVKFAGLLSYSGLPQLEIWPLFLIVFVANGLGEEIGWRAYLQPRLQRIFGTASGVVVLTIVWASWHLPLFHFLAAYQHMDMATKFFGFGLGLLCGAFVLAHVTAVSRGSALAAALWHTLYNLGTATQLGSFMPIFLSVVVMIWGGTLILMVAFRPSMRKLIQLPAPP